MRQLVANNIKKIQNRNNALKEKRPTLHTKREHLKWDITNSIKRKITQNQLIITKADKGSKQYYCMPDDDLMRG
jgi:hypothetical protein